ncbi:subunit C of CCAAT-binding factor [Ordospora colligata]|uniref:Subunit C of CCAAT-binding factor n=1 Tax=Ordospora colligata OC4 TaxID=1354746 RepID=A0A0B2UNL9_9MICR|nr:subunit C of CCAAT-binding factor [Ordospora colligata OC4]KHN70555.1 subunit C of CCAAT-binding factor [Ordospora colligata OC4]TBU17305.1 subunit C of CCAAT-binding factor [Ordospora colligata]TBU17555.1 subunit C of CCAAT-binding factor [Ordospora colligata]TBU19735.1 subunit C of CCAAT-binding factor [Ordospora colligata]
MKSSYSLSNERISKFWHQVFKESAEDRIILKELSLPLARIKRLMKVEEGVRMVASEVPILFSMVTEKFVEELTLRAWINTEENNRRILQKSDLTAAVKTSEIFDFLIYVVPRNDFAHVFNSIGSEKMQSREDIDSEPQEAYMQQHMFNERMMMNGPATQIHQQDFYARECRGIGDVPDATGNTVHPSDYRNAFDISFNREHDS